MKIILLTILAFSLTACVPDYKSNNTDNSVNTDYGNGTVLFCDAGGCSVAPEGTDPSDGDSTIGVYDPEYTQAECNAAGFFYCPIEQMCLNVPLETGTCPTHN